MNFRTTAAAFIAAVFVAGCGMTPPKASDGHIRAEERPDAEGSIPPPVQLAPQLPRPRPTLRPETYSVVVNNVRVQELLFSLARDAKLNVDVHPGVTGSVTLNAIDQTLPQLLTRIAKQADIRYEIDGPNLAVMRDTPYLRIYRIDYLNMERTVKGLLGTSGQVSGTGGAAGGAPSAGGNTSTSTLTSDSKNAFWTTLIANVKDLLRETDKVVSTTPPAAPAPAQQAPAAAAGQPQVAGQGSAPPPSTPAVEFREAASVIANPESGILSIRASSRQHEKIQEFLDNVMASAKRQVLIEATVAEVRLDNQYQRGIDWSRLRTGSAGLQFQQSSGGTPAGINTGAFIFGYAAGRDFTSAMKLLESFGDVKVLSSPKISVLNNQTAVLKVVDNLVYFTIQGTTVAGTVGSPPVSTFTTTLNSVPVGFVMSLMPQISDTDTVLINVRPSITRKIGDVPDPNPSLTAGGVQSLIPVIQTREMESLLRVQSGQIAVLGGLMQDQVSNTEDGIPGVSGLPGIGELFRQRKDTLQKTELVIFLRPTVIRDASLDGDYRRFNSLLPDADFLRRPNPGKAEAYAEPGAR